MAEIIPGFSLIGSISNLSAYKRRGSDKIIIRTKGGPSKQQMKSSSSFEKTRKNNKEFGGRSTASKWIRKGLWPQTLLADYNISGPLNSLLQPVQAMDSANQHGRRSVLLSKQPGLLAGFSLNQLFPFDTVVRNPITFNLSRKTLSASVTTPTLLPGINFQPPGKHPLYSFVATLGIIPDVILDGTKYVAHPGYDLLGCIYKESEWYSVLNGSPAIHLDLSLPTPPPDEAFSIMLSIGIRYGTVSNGGVVQQVENAGCAKVLGLA